MLLLLILSIEIHISPNPLEGRVNEEIPFNIIILDESGNSINGDISTDIIPPNLGKISGRNFIADREGRGILRCNVRIGDKTVRDFAYIKITGKVAKRIIPGSAVLNTEEIQLFRVPGEKNLKWKIIPEEIGIVNNGEFRAVKPGIGRIVAILEDGRICTAFIRVRGKLSPLNIRPSFKHLKVGEEFRFKLNDKEDTDIVWRVIPEEIGIIDNGGVFRALSPGRAIITARTETDIYRAVIVVSGKIEMRIIPERAEIETGETIKFRLEFKDNIVHQNIPVKWKIIPERAGIIRKDGTLTAGRIPIKARVVAVIPGRFGTGIASSRINIISSEYRRIKVKPEVAELSLGTNFDFDIINENIPVRWKVIPDNLGDIDRNGTFTPGRSGSGLIIAEPLENLNIKPGRAVVLIGGSTNFEINLPSPTVVEGFGIPITINSPLQDYRVIWRVRPDYAGRVTLNNKFISHKLQPGKDEQEVKIYGLFYKNREFLGWDKVTLKVVKRTK